MENTSRVSLRNSRASSKAKQARVLACGPVDSSWMFGLWRLGLAIGLSGGFGLLGSGFGHLDDLIEGFGIGNGDFGEHFSIQIDAGGLEAKNESAIGDATHSAGGIDAQDPELAVIALDQLAVLGLIDPGADNRFLDASPTLAT